MQLITKFHGSSQGLCRLKDPLFNKSALVKNPQGRREKGSLRRYPGGRGRNPDMEVVL